MVGRVLLPLVCICVNDNHIFGACLAALINLAFFTFFYYSFLALIFFSFSFFFILPIYVQCLLAMYVPFLLIDENALISSIITRINVFTRIEP